MGRDLLTNLFDTMQVYYVIPSFYILPSDPVRDAKRYKERCKETDKR